METEVFKLNFAPQNIMLNQDNQVAYNAGSVSPPRMNFQFEDHIPVPLSPIISPSSSTDEENEEDELDYERIFGNNFSQSREYLEPSLPEHVLSHQNNTQIQQQEYVEPYFLKQKTAVIRHLH